MQPNFPREIWSGSQAKGGTVQGTVLPESWLPDQIASTSTIVGSFGCTGWVLLAWISRGQFGFLYEVYIQKTGRARQGELCVVDFLPF